MVDEWGGNPLEIDVNAQYVGLEFQHVYIAACCFIVWLIIPGIGFLYGGLSRRKSALALLFQSFMVAATITFQWMFWGYSLAYSKTAGPFIGDLSNFVMRGVMAGPSIGNAALPDILFCFYQLLFWYVGWSHWGDVSVLVSANMSKQRLHRANRGWWRL